MHVGLNLLGLPSVRQGGAGLSARMIAEGLADRDGVAVTVLAGPQVAEELAVLDLTVHVSDIPNGKARRVRSVAAALRDPAAFEDARGRPAADALAGCDVVHYTLGFMVPPVHDRPRVVTCHDLQHRDVRGAFTPAERALRRLRWDRAVEKADHVVTVSSFSAHRVVATLDVDPRRVTVVHLACAPAFAGERPGPPPVDGRYLMYPASPLPAKNHVRLLEAFAAVRAEDPELRLVLVGPALHDWEAVDAEIAALALGDAVVQPGTVSLADLHALYAGAVGLVFPSLYEGFGLPVLEAMTAGCPVVASRAGSVPEILGEGGRTFDPFDADAIADGIRALTALSEEERAREVARGAAQARRFSTERMIDGALRAYERAIAERRRAGGSR